MTPAPLARRSPRPPERFSATYALDPDHVYAVGDVGVVYRCSASLNRCTRFRSNSAQNLNDVFAVDLQNIYAVGGGEPSSAAMAVSEVCTVFPIQGSSALTGVWTADPGFIVAPAGLNGQLRSAAIMGSAQIGNESCRPPPTSGRGWPQQYVGLGRRVRTTPVTQWNGGGCGRIFNKTAPLR